MDLIVCCRSTRGADFGDDVGTARHLAVPKTEQPHRPVHQLGLKAWIADVTAVAETSRDPVSGNPVGNDPVRCDVKVHVLAHSMGAYVVREAFDKADDAAEPSSKNWSVSQLMFCAADVSSDSLGPSDSSRSLYLHSVRFTNDYNRHDAVLSVSGAKRIGISPRAGRIGLPDTAPSKAVDVDCSDYYDAHRDSFDAVPNKDHSFYFADKVCTQDLHETIKGDRDRLAFDTRVVRGGRVHLKVPSA